MALTTKSASDMLLPGETIGGFLKLGYGVNGKEWSRTTALFGRDDDSGLDDVSVLARNSVSSAKAPASIEGMSLSERESVLNALLRMSGHFT